MYLPPVFSARQAICLPSSAVRPKPTTSAVKSTPDCLELLAERARVAAAGFEPVGDEDDGRLVLGVFQRFGRLLDGRGQRRLAEEFQTVGGGR